VLSVDIDEEHRIASVTVPERMLSLAIGREGQNARLAARLTGWRIDIRSDVSVAEAKAAASREADAERPADAGPAEAETAPSAAGSETAIEPVAAPETSDAVADGVAAANVKPKRATKAAPETEEVSS
jgi:N utilization substance protein A